jgi:hypothetical protein
MESESYYYRKGIAALDPARVADLKLRATARVAKRKLNLDQIRARRRSLGRLARFEPENDVKWTDPLENYPLIDSYSLGGNLSSNPDHVYTYINAAYEAGLTKKGS